MGSSVWCVTTLASMHEFSRMRLVCYFFALLQVSYGDVVTSGSRSSGECEATLSLHVGDKEIKFTKGHEDLEESLVVDKAVLVGCGDCYRLYEKKGGKEEVSWCQIKESI